MLRIICVLVILDAYNGHFTQVDGLKQILHRAQRNYASQTKNEELVTTEDNMKPHRINQPVFGTRLKPRIKIYYDYPIETNKGRNSDNYTLLRRYDDGQNSEKLSSTEENLQYPNKLTDHKPLKSDDRDISATHASKKQKPHNLLESESKNSFELYDLTSSESEGFGKRVSRDYFEINYKPNLENGNVDASEKSKNLFGRSSNGKPKSLLSFRSSSSQSWKRNHNSLKTSLHHILYSQNFLGTEKASESNCNATSNTLFLRKHGSDSVNVKGEILFKAPDYLPPVDKTTTNRSLENLPPKDSKKPCCNGKPSIITFSTTKRPNTIKTSRRPYYTIDTITKHPSHTTTRTRPTTTIPATTKKPYYIPFDNQRPKTTKRPNCPGCSSTSGPFYIPVPKPSTTIPESPKTDRSGDPKVFRTTTSSRPVERGDVPDDESIEEPTQGDVGPAMAIPVPTEPDESIPTTMSPTTTTSSPPSTTTTKMLSFNPAPSLAMQVPPEPEEIPSLTTPVSPSTTTITPPPSTVSITTPMTTKPTIQTIPSDDNRHLLPEPGSTTSMVTETMTTTTNNMTEMTTPMPYRGPQYLLPKVPTRIIPAINKTSSDPAPARAMPVPPEPDVPPSPFPPTSTTSADTFRAAEPSNTTTNRSDDSFKAPEHLPPQNASTFPPKPAMAMQVTSEPECSLDANDAPDIDQRSLIKDPCSPTPKPPTKRPFKGLSYLPPMSKSRIGRSSNKTLRLSDLTGTPRPVWYAGIYMKTTNPYLPICGGSIVREDVVISAAHCFWDDSIGQRPATLFAVAARKIYKPYNDPMDKKAQKSDVLDIKIPPRFLGAKTSFQEDLAIVKLASPFAFSQSVYGLRPICVDFGVEFDLQQLKSGYYGTVAGWGYTDAAGTHTQRLLWLELPYVEIEKCIGDSEDAFLKYITCDKLCAGENDTGKALCRGDSGGGLAFWQGEPGHATPYLRGIASTAPTADAECNVFAYASFTHVRAHRTFLRDHVPDIENCRFWG